MPDLDDLFKAARADLSAQPPLATGLPARLEGIMPAPRRSRMAPIGLLAVALAGGALWLFHAPAPPPAPFPLTPVTVNLDDLLITQRLACVVDNRTLLVAWTTSANLPALDRPTHHHHYLEIPLRSASIAEGTFHASLFIADPDIEPALTPPTILASLPDHRVIGFAASPTFVPTPDLAAAIHAAAPVGVPPVTRHEIDAALAARAASI